MELFALGHGNGYTEDDVRAGCPGADRVDSARPGAKTMLVAHRQDRTSKTLFGVTKEFRR